jgi:hypothetical protein
MNASLIFRSETFRMMLAGFLIGTAGVTAMSVSAPSVAAPSVAVTQSAPR